MPQNFATLVSQIVEHVEIDEHLEEIAENLIVKHLLYTTVEPLYKGHPNWWPFKRGGLSWGVK